MAAKQLGEGIEFELSSCLLMVELLIGRHPMKIVNLSFISINQSFVGLVDL